MSKVTLALSAILALTGMLAMAAPTKIGADKCKMCHKAQYESWQSSKHATSNPAMDCEACHGPGSDYKSMSVMKDKNAAIKAGLHVPVKADCAKCHGKGKVPAITPEMFAKVHAHKK